MAYTPSSNSNQKCRASNNCRYISTLHYIDDLLRTVANDNHLAFAVRDTQVPAFAGNRVQYIADWSVVVARADSLGNFTHETLVELGAGINEHMRRLEIEEWVAIRNFYVATLKDSRRRTEVEVRYRRWIFEGSFFERMHLLIELGREAA